MIDIQTLFSEHRDVLQETERLCQQDILLFAAACKAAIANGNTVFLMGNGGSACDCQHFAAELVGRFQKERQAMAAVAMTTDTSILTALGNDYGFEAIFARQVEALVKQQDVVVGISTSGNSPNIIRAIEEADKRGAITVGLTGRSGGKLKQVCDICICVPSDVTARIQEAHLLIEHIVCQLIEE